MKKKNIVFILADQLRADYLGCYGAEFARTPNLDALAKEGRLYQNVVSPSPICVPARASLLTGRNSIENGVLENANWLRPDHEDCGVKTWPKILGEHGYETIAIGKMHFYPWDIMEGFESRIISEDKRSHGIVDDYADYLKTKGLKKYHAIEIDTYQENRGAYANPFPREDQADVWIASQACEYLEKREDDRPLAMMVGFLSPHEPYDPDRSLLEDFPLDKMPEPLKATKETDRFKAMNIKAYQAGWSQLDFTTFTDEQKRMVKAHYLACIKDVDLGVGRIIETLKKKGMYEDTVIIFSADHGDFAGDYDMIGKKYFYEPSVHVPMIIRDGDLEERGLVENHIVNLTDLYATLLHIGGVENCETSESKLLSCYGKIDEERIIFGSTDIGWLARWKQWKYTCYNNDLQELYNLEEDPQEQHNLAGNAETKTIEEKLSKAVNAWVMKSIMKANDEKRAGLKVVKDPVVHGSRGWKRPYPYCENV